MRGKAFAILVFSILAGCGGGSSTDSEMGGGSGAGGEGSTPDGTGGSGERNLCEEGCVLTLEADCDNGPASQAECVADCEELRAGECGTEYQAFQACADGESVECGDEGIPVVPACTSEQAVFIGCLN